MIKLIPHSNSLNTPDPDLFARFIERMAEMLMDLDAAEAIEVEALELAEAA